MAKKEYKTERVQFMAPESLVKAIEDYQFGNRIKSQGEAIRQLIEMGLKAKK